MRTIFFTNPENKNRVAMTVTDLSIEELYDYNIIPEDGVYLIKDDDDTSDLFPNPKDEEQYFDSLSFDDPNNPSKVIIDVDSAKSAWLEMVRLERNRLLSITDEEFIKAMGMDNEDLAALIKEDKRALRDLTDTVNLKKIKTIEELNQLRPPELEIDYEHRYKHFTPKQKNSRTRKKSSSK